MPQEFQILRCCECERFQVHHVKKAKKWQCKVCGQKQSMIRAFFIGSSRDCRVNVQKLNFQAGEQEMKRELNEGCSSVGDNIDSEIGDEDIDSPRENEVVENNWAEKRNGMDEGDWMDEDDWVDAVDESDWVDGVDENEWIDEADWDANNPSGVLESMDNRNSESDCEDELPRKKQRCASYSKTETAEESCIQPNEVVENQGYFSASSLFKYGNSSKQIDLPSISSSDVPKTESEKECDLFEGREENPLTEVVKSRPNSVLKPTRGFQLIFNEAKKQRNDLSYELDDLL